MDYYIAALDRLKGEISEYIDEKGNAVSSRQHTVSQIDEMTAKLHELGNEFTGSDLLLRLPENAHWKEV